MKNLMLAIIAMLMLASCSSTYQTASIYDDVYYSPGTSDQVVVEKRVGTPTSDVSYGNNASEDRFKNTAQPEAEIIGSHTYSQGSGYYQDTLAQPESSSNEYYYSDESDEYYDYEYAARIKRFNDDCGNLGYYDPYYTNACYGACPGFSMGFGYGMPSSYFSIGFNYGWGYPYYGYYDPWYYPWYDPWYYPYYGGSYWMGYNHGYYDGYYNGYYGGGYFPEGGGSGYGYYYGPRGTRGSGLIGSTGERESRISNEVAVEKNASVQGRETRTEPGSLFGSGLSQQTADPANSERVARQTEVQKQNANTSTNSVARDPRAEKLAKPASVVPSENNAKNEAVLRETRNNPAPDVEANKLSKPVINSQSSAVTQDRNARTTPATQQQKIAKPAATNEGSSSVVSREKKYAKPASNTLERQGQTKNYSSPVYNKPRSSNEYTIPGSRTVRTTPQGESSVERSSTSPAQQNNVRTAAPSKSSSSFSTQPKTTINNNSSKPVRSYSSPSSTSSPQRSYSAPARSSSYSPPSSGGGSSKSSGSSSSGSSSGGGGGKRGR